MQIRANRLGQAETRLVKIRQELEKKFEGEGRVLIRPSGTEPLVRVMIEGKDIEQMRADAEKLAQIIERNLM